MTILQLLNFLVPELSETLALLTLYGSVALALVQCFFGYRLQQLWFTALVFGIAALLAYSISIRLLPDRIWLCLLIALGCGLVVSLFTWRLVQAAAFGVAFLSVFGAVGAMLGELHPTLSLIAALVLGVMAGILAAKFRRTAVILITAAGSGWKAANLLRQCIPDMAAATTLILAAVLIAAGVIFQFATTSKKG